MHRRGRQIGQHLAHQFRIRASRDHALLSPAQFGLVVSAYAFVACLSGLLAATWASMVSLGRDGYRKYAKDILHTAGAMTSAVRSHPELRILGRPPFLFSFTSDVFDVYHVNDFMRTRGWRFNGQQYPNALHMAVTRPQTQPGVAERFAADLDDAVDYANAHVEDKPASGAIYGGIAGGLTDEADVFIKAVMADMMDGFQQVPEEA